jgi:hypothetical protein
LVPSNITTDSTKSNLNVPGNFAAGALTGTSASFSGNVTAGALNGTSASFSGNVTAGAAVMGGPISFNAAAATTLSNLNGAAQSVVLTPQRGLPQTIVASGQYYPGLVKLPSGNLLEIHTTTAAVSVNLLTMNGNIFTSITAESAPTIPGGYALYYASLTLLSNNTVFLAYSLQQTGGSQLAAPGYIIGTLSGDTVAWGSYSAITMAGQSWCYDPSPVIQLSNGNLMLPIWCGQAGAAPAEYPLTSGVITSTNLGSTWSSYTIVGSVSNDPGPSSNGYDESALALYPNGDVIDLMRREYLTGDPDSCYAVSVLKSGSGTWSSPVNLGFPAAGSIPCYGAGRPTVMVYQGQLILIGRTLQTDTGGYTGTAAWISTDEGNTWTPQTSLVFGKISNTHGDQYDAMTLLPNGSIGLVNADGFGAIVFTTIATNGVPSPQFPFMPVTNPTYQSIGAINLTSSSTHQIYPSTNPVGTLQGSNLTEDSTDAAHSWILSYGVASSSTGHYQIYFPGYDSVGFPRIAIDPSIGSTQLCIGDDNSGNMAFGNCGFGGTGKPFTWTNEWLQIAQTGGVNIPAGPLSVGGVAVPTTAGGTWTPVATGLTQTGGSATITGTYKFIGPITYYAIQIVPATSTSSVANTTHISLPAQPTISQGCTVSDNNIFAFPGGCRTDSRSTGFAYPPTWTSDTATIIISGWYW